MDCHYKGAELIPYNGVPMTNVVSICDDFSRDGHADRYQKYCYSDRVLPSF